MRDNTLKYLLVLPAVVVVFATAIWPLIEAARLSFTVGRLNRPGSLEQYLGWENYTWAFLEEAGFLELGLGDGGLHSSDGRVDHDHALWGWRFCSLRVGGSEVPRKPC